MALTGAGISTESGIPDYRSIALCLAAPFGYTAGGCVDAGLTIVRWLCSGIAVNPSMNPSRVQLRRCAIPGSLVTAIPKHALNLCIVWILVA